MFYLIEKGLTGYQWKLPDNLTSTVKLFADDTSLFSAVINSDTSVQKLNEDFQEIADWAYILNMQFNRDINKQPQG